MGTEQSKVKVKDKGQADKPKGKEKEKEKKNTVEKKEKKKEKEIPHTSKEGSENEKGLVVYGVNENENENENESENENEEVGSEKESVSESESESESSDEDEEDSTISSFDQDSLDGFIVFSDQENENENENESEWDYFSDGDYHSSNENNAGDDGESESENDEWIDLNGNGKEVSAILPKENLPFSYRRLSKKRKRKGVKDDVDQTGSEDDVTKDLETEKSEELRYVFFTESFEQFNPRPQEIQFKSVSCTWTDEEKDAFFESLRKRGKLKAQEIAKDTGKGLLEVRLYLAELDWLRKNVEKKYLLKRGDFRMAKVKLLKKGQTEIESDSSDDSSKHQYASPLYRSREKKFAIEADDKFTEKSVDSLHELLREFLSRVLKDATSLQYKKGLITKTDIIQAARKHGIEINSNILQIAHKGQSESEQSE